MAYVSALLVLCFVCCFVAARYQGVPLHRLDERWTQVIFALGALILLVEGLVYPVGYIIAGSHVGFFVVTCIAGCICAGLAFTMWVGMQFGPNAKGDETIFLTLTVFAPLLLNRLIPMVLWS